MTPRTSPNDTDLVRRLRSGEGDAVALVRARHWGDVFDFALRMTASVPRARDIADEVFADISGLDDDDFRAWAFRRAHRLIMASPVTRPSGAIDDDVEIVVDLRDDAAPLDRSLVARVWAAVSRLDRQTQAVVDLHLRQGLTASELAPILGMSERAAAASVQEMKRTAAESIAVQLLRSDPDHLCDELSAISSDEAAIGHVETCENCSSRRTSVYPPLQILGALRVVPASPFAVPVSAVAIPEPRRRVATPVGILAVVFGIIATVALGYLTWDNILAPLGSRLVDVVSPPTTVAPVPTSPTGPVAHADSAMTSEDVAVLIDVTGNDDAAEAAEIAVVSPPDHGSAEVVAGGVRFTPAPDFFGTDTFQYTLSDPEGRTTAASVTLEVVAVDDAPRLAVAAPSTTGEDQPLVVDLTDFVVEVDGDPLQIVAVDRTSREGGSVDETLRYMPARDFNGTDAFSIVVSDGVTELTVPVVIDVVPVNDPPTGPVTRTWVVDEDGELTVDALAGWSDVDGDVLTVSASAGSSAGASLQYRGSTIVYRPAPDYFGEDSVRYVVGDGEATVEVAVAIEVRPIQDAPTVTRDTFDVPENARLNTVLGTLLATDVEGDDFRFQLAESVAGIAISPGGTVTLTSKLDHETVPRAVIPAVVTDATGASRRFDVILRVGDVDEAPTGDDQMLLVRPFLAKGQTIGKVAVTDPEGAALRFTEVGGDNAGAVVVIESTGAVRTSRIAEPELFPLTVSVQATDPAGHSVVVLVTLRLDDFTGPEVGDPSLTRTRVWEQASPGVTCSQGTNRTDITVDVFDTSGIFSATITWSAVFDGTPVSGTTSMSLGGGQATGSFIFGADLVEPGGESVVTGRVVVVDWAGNKTTSKQFRIVVESCP